MGGTSSAVMRDTDRVSRVVDSLQREHLDALVCSVPSNVLLLSGYWPVIGDAMAAITREGAVGILAPEDEAGFAKSGWADAVETFSAASLDTLKTVADSAVPALRRVLSTIGIHSGATIGYEGGETFDTSRYAATFSYGAELPSILSSAVEHMSLVDASELLSRLRATLTSRELERVREACAIAREAFIHCAARIRPGVREVEIASILRQQLSDPDRERADGFAYCMAGRNSARAYAAFQESGVKPITNGDVVLMHCNSYCRGFWTDITRTFTMDAPDDLQRRILTAIFAARDEALAAVRPGTPAARVDAAARKVMTAYGLGDAFKHATGHGVGFAAINHNARPRIHPRSDDVLESGMVMNIEPAAYLETFGMRQCDMVAVTASGAERLTAFQSSLDELQLRQHASTGAP